MECLWYQHRSLTLHSGGTKGPSLRADHNERENRPVEGKLHSRLLSVRGFAEGLRVSRLSRLFNMFRSGFKPRVLEVVNERTTPSWITTTAATAELFCILIRRISFLRKIGFGANVCQQCLVQPVPYGLSEK